jgi:hypothetical protein
MSQQALAGGCHCGNIGVSAAVTYAPEACRPRACDCEFCRKHGAAWVSDPHGSLLIRIADESAAGRYAQGDGLAEMLLCRRCGVLVAALYAGQTLHGVVNVSVLEARAEFAPAEPVSPRRLSPQAKVSRWQSLWFPNVTVTASQPPQG